MLWPRQTRPFGLPNEDDDAVIGDIVMVSIGHVLRATATDIVDAPLPVQLAGLLRRLERRERSGRGNVTQRRKRAMHREPIRRTAQPRPADRDADAAGVVGEVVAP
jgi:hypothetical protein